MWLKISICNLHIVFCTIHVQPHTRRQFHFTGWPVHTVSTFQQPISQYLILSKERRILWSATWLMLTHWLARYCVARACVGFAIAKTVNRQDSWAGAKQLDQYSLSRHQLTACLLFPFNLKGKRKNNNKNIGLRVKPITTRRDVMHESALTSSPQCAAWSVVSAHWVNNWRCSMIYEWLGFLLRELEVCLRDFQLKLLQALRSRTWL